MKTGDRVKINDKLQLAYKDEEEMINQEAQIIEVTDFVFPIKVRFLNPSIEAIHIGLGGRMFDEFELDLI